MFSNYTVTTLLSFFYTCFLFTKSDIKTTVVPVVS